MRLVILSDTHGKLNMLDIPKGDVLIHTGDATNLGSMNEFIKFQRDLWSYKDKFRHILFVPGNHDWLAARDINFAKTVLRSHIKMLVDEPIEINGTVFYGSPWQPRFMDWAFNLNPVDLRRKWKLIPDNVEILLTHTPKYGTLDKVDNRHVGCAELLERTMSLTKLKLHCFGHIHEYGGKIIKDKILNVNASMISEDFREIRKPIVIDKIGDEYTVISDNEVEELINLKIDLKKAKAESKKITANGMTHSIQEWADILGYKVNSLKTKLSSGYDIEDILDARDI